MSLTWCGKLIVHRSSWVGAGKSNEETKIQEKVLDNGIRTNALYFSIVFPIWILKWFFHYVFFCDTTGDYKPRLKRQITFVFIRRNSSRKICNRWMTVMRRNIQGNKCVLLCKKKTSPRKYRKAWPNDWVKKSNQHYCDRRCENEPAYRPNACVCFSNVSCLKTVRSVADGDNAATAQQQLTSRKFAFQTSAPLRLSTDLTDQCQSFPLISRGSASLESW